MQPPTTESVLSAAVASWGRRRGAVAFLRRDASGEWRVCGADGTRLFGDKSARWLLWLLGEERMAAELPVEVARKGCAWLLALLPAAYALL